MNPAEVQQLATLENDRIAHSLPPQVHVTSEAGPTNRNDPTRRAGWAAYWPLGADRPTQDAIERADSTRVLDNTATGTTLIVRFTSAVDPQREFLLPIDLSDWPGDDLQVASGAVFEALLRLTDSAHWQDEKTVVISSRVAIVVP
jgi:hypothetical protein